MDAEIPAKRKMKRLVALAAVGLVVGAAVVLGVHFWSSKQSAAQAPAVGSSAANAPASVAISDKSIAVLPFADLSEKHDQEYFAAGMAQEITDLLSKMPGLRVVGRASACQFSGTSGDPHSIGAKLGAAYLVEGSVRHSGSRIRVSAQLCKNVRQMAVPWAVRYRT
jgi:TolB-like protein